MDLYFYSKYNTLYYCFKLMDKLEKGEDKN